MKDYSKIASKYGVIGCYIDTSDFIESYKINREQNCVEIVFMDDEHRTDPLYEGLIEELDERQLEQLDIMREKINPRIDSRLELYTPLIALYGVNTILQYSLGNWLAGTCWLLGGSVYSYLIYPPYKLKKEMTLVKWTMDNKEYVDEIIKKEVEEKHPKTIETNTLNPVKAPYPTTVVPYSENLYEDGINLSNIDELSIKQLKKLKKQATKLRGKSYV